MGSERATGLCLLVVLLASARPVQGQTESDEQGRTSAAESGVVSRKPEIRFQHISIEHGLPQSHVVAIAQDQLGFMWLGTEEGLARYDGSRMKVFGTEVLPSANITALAADKLGKVWIGTELGLAVYDLRTDSFTRLSEDPITSVRTDEAGVWVGLATGRVQRIANGQNRLEDFFNTKSEEVAISGIAQDGSGGYWIGLLGGGVVHTDAKGGVIQLLLHGETERVSLSANLVSAVHLDRDGALWIGTEETGLDRYDPRTKKLTRYRQGAGTKDLTDDRVLFVVDDTENGIWVGTKHGLNHVLPGEQRVEKYLPNSARPDGLSHPWLSSGFFDREGVFWIGTLARGVSKLDKLSAQFKYIFTGDAATALYEESDDVLWIGTHPGALIRLDHKSERLDIYTSLRLDDGTELDLTQTWITQITKDARGRMWIGGEGMGLVRLDPARMTARHFREVLGDGEGTGIWHIVPASDGHLWIATTGGGVVRFAPDSGAIERWGADGEGGLPSPYVLAVHPDRSDPNILWVGTAQGVARLDLQRRTSEVFNEEEPARLSHSHITSIHQTDDGALWLATYGGGFCRFEPTSEKATCYGKEAGLSNSSVYGILEGANGFLWMSTNGGGLVRFEPKSEQLVTFDSQDGALTEFAQASFHKGRSGRLYFGSPQSLIWFNPSEIELDTRPPEVVMTGFRLFNEEVKLGRPIWHGPKIDLGYRDTILAFQFAALSFAAPNKMRYQYRIEGLHGEWINADGPVAPISGIDDGHYTLRVRARNRHGILSKVDAAISFRIAPPPWRTWWAYILYGLGAIGILVGVVLFQNRRVVRAQQLNRLAAVERDLELTGVVQSGFMPRNNFVQNNGVRVFGFCRPAETCGGDWWWYDHSMETQHSIVVGDVTGHGPGPAMVTAAVATAFRVQAQVGLHGVSSKMSILNDEVLLVGASSYHMTMSAVEIDDRTGKFTFYSAGGPPVLTLRENDRARAVPCRGTPLGVAGFSLGKTEGQLVPGERMLIFTDGIPEIKLQNSNHYFGLRRFSRLFESTRAMPVDVAANSMISNVDELHGGQKQEDDWTLVIIEWG